MLMWEAIPKLLSGIYLTIGLTVLSCTLGLILALVLAMAWLARSPFLRVPASVYMLFFRGTPLLVQIFIVYFGSGQFEWIKGTPLWVLLKQPFWCAVIALTMGTTAYTGYIIGGAIKMVPAEMVEAAKALGLPFVDRLRFVVLPLAIRQALPAYGNEVILQLKATSLASTITLLDLTGVARILVSRTYAPYEIFLAAGAIYLGLTYITTQLLYWGERRLSIERRMESVMVGGKGSVGNALKHR